MLGEIPILYRFNGEKKKKKKTRRNVKGERHEWCRITPCLNDGNDAMPKKKKNKNERERERERYLYIQTHDFYYKEM